MAAAWAASAPECKPLYTTDQLLNWTSDSVDEACKSWEPLRQELRPQDANRPRLLACHDMRGGYLEDRLSQGGGDADFYYFRHWHAIDLFVYFSHHLVTIPPVGWVNAGHRHGVPVLGTLITEWEQGAANCRQLFGSLAAAEHTAAQLAAIAQAHGFDGWVINIENAVDPQHVPNLIHFLRALTSMMRQGGTPWAQVVWYDAVTVEGQLKWQDTLNDLNRPFFDACTALWVNYTWKAHVPAQVREEAGERHLDVYMGVDVFGRGTYGGGGFHVGVGLSAAKAAGLSAALFAFAWPFDAQPEPDDTRSWQERDEALWEIISDAWGGRRPLCMQLPLDTDFSIGAGRSTQQQGVLQSPCAWYNLSRQGLQPSLHIQPALPPGALSIDMDVGVPATKGAASPVAAPTLHSWGSWFWGGLLGRALAAALGRLSQLLRTLGKALLARGPQVLRDLWRFLCDNLLRPVARFGRAAPRRPLRAAPTLRAAYSGGSCVGIEGEVHGCQRVSLFNLSIPIPAAGLEVGFAAASCCEVQPVLVLTLAAGKEAGCLKKAQGSPASTVLLLPSKAVDVSVLGWLGAGAAGSASLVHTQAPVEAVGPVWDSQQPQQQQQQLQQKQQQQEEESEVGRVVQALPWVRRRYRLFPGQLPVAPGQLVTGVDLLLLPPEGRERCEARMYLGELWMADLGAPEPPCSVGHLACTQLQLGAPGFGGGVELSACLSWQMPPAVRCCHVHCSFDGGEQQWLGVAVGRAFRVHSVLVPAGAAAVSFHVTPVACSGGELQPQQAGMVTASLPR